MIQAPPFSKHIIHKKRIIHVLVSIRGVKSTTLIDYGATNNFLKRAFIKKTGLEPRALSMPKECKLGDGITQVTYEYKGEVEIVEGRIP